MFSSPALLESLGLEQLWGDEVGLVWGAKEEPKWLQDLIPCLWLLPSRCSRGVPGRGLEPERPSEEQGQGQGEERVVGGRICRWPLPGKSPGGTGTWVVSARGQTARQILSLLIEQEKDLFSYSTPNLLQLQPGPEDLVGENFQHFLPFFFPFSSISFLYESSRRFPPLATHLPVPRPFNPG